MISLCILVAARLVSQCLFDVESTQVADGAARILLRLASDDDERVATTFFGLGDGSVDFDDDGAADNAAARLCLAFEKLSETMDVRALDFLVALYIASPSSAGTLSSSSIDLFIDSFALSFVYSARRSTQVVVALARHAGALADE